MQVVVGTRGSRLALTQTGEVLERLKLLADPISAVMVEIKSTGDVMPETPLAKLSKGIFIKELEVALLEGRIDMAVHSLKDLPVEIPDDLSVVVVCLRQDPRDVLVSKADCSLAEMKSGAVVGTSSQRRMVQLRALREDLQVEPIRGNVETRLDKALGQDYDGVVVAAAGVARLGLEGRISQYFEPQKMVPEPGQGALAVEIRSEDKGLLEILAQIEDTQTSIAVAAERAFVEEIGGGCKVPIAAYASVEREILHMVGMVASEDGSQMVKESLESTAGDPREAGNLLARKLLSLGAGDILKMAADG
ncbi:MAG: hydroxymethylbilane synthase [Dehalococcoidia bacterium]|nr:hydroxymethylbilane synthase [Dehalococcoidia bacterium]